LLLSLILIITDSSALLFKIIALLALNFLLHKIKLHYSFITLAIFLPIIIIIL